MKKTTAILLVCVAILIILVGAAFAQGSNNPTPEYLSTEELNSRLEKAGLLVDCNLPIPAKEGSPIDMGPFDDYTRTGVCIWEYGVEGITFSRWPGSASYPTQRFQAYWRLVDANTGEAIKEVRTDITKNEWFIKLENEEMQWVEENSIRRVPPPMLTK